MRMDNEIIVSKYLKTDKYPKHHNNQKNNIKFMLIYYLTYLCNSISLQVFLATYSLITSYDTNFVIFSRENRKIFQSFIDLVDQNLFFIIYSVERFLWLHDSLQLMSYKCLVLLSNWGNICQDISL